MTVPPMSAGALALEAALVRVVRHLPARLLDTAPGMSAYVSECLSVEADLECNDTTVGSRLEAVRANRRALAAVRLEPKLEQRSPEWHAAREHILTASDLAQAMGRSAYGTRQALLLQKTKVTAREVFNEFAQKAVDNGVMFEPMALRAYQQARGCVPVYDFGLLRHPTLRCFGASPDGITALGTMIEIKCPLRRKLTGAIPEHYYLQMQGQMATCGITETDYVEAAFQRYDRSDYLAGTGIEEDHGHGVTLRFSRQGETEYEHSPANQSESEACEWADAAAGARLEADAAVDLAAVVFWRCKELHIHRVPFDAEAWAGTLAPAIQSFHDERQAIMARLNEGLTPYEGWVFPTPKVVKDAARRRVEVLVDFEEDDE